MERQIYLGRNIRYLRKKRGWTQEHLADILGYSSYTSIQKWESNNANPPVRVVQKLADLFGTDIGTLTLIDMEYAFDIANKALSEDDYIKAEMQKLNISGKEHLLAYAKFLSGTPEYQKEKDGDKK